jgi:hypothetical protein
VPFSAPELFVSARQNFATDIYAFGMTMWQVCDCLFADLLQGFTLTSSLVSDQDHSVLSPEKSCTAIYDRHFANDSTRQTTLPRRMPRGIVQSANVGVDDRVLGRESSQATKYQNCHQEVTRCISLIERMLRFQ